MSKTTNETKTINIVCGYSSIYGGNFIPSILHLAKELSKTYNVFFTFPLDAKEQDWVKTIEQDGIKIFYIDFSKKKFKKDLKHINKDEKVSLIYGHFIPRLRIKMMYLFNRKMKIAFHMHSDFSGGKETFKDKIKKLVEYKIIRNDATYIYVSDGIVPKHVSKKKHLVVLNALSNDRKLKSNPIKTFLKIKEHNTIFLLFSWSPYIKGLDIVINAMSEVKDKNIRLIVVHGFSDGPNTCKDYLAHAVPNSTYLSDGRILFVPPTQDVFSYYETSDVFISASRSEGFSYSVLEALYCNLKVISSDIPGVRWAKKYDNALFFENGNSHELAARINELANYKSNHIFNERILHEFDINEWCNKIKEILSMII